MEEISLHSPLGKRSRTCAIGGETETETLLFHIKDRDQNADEGNMLGDLWALISSHPVIVGVILLFIFVAIFGEKDHGSSGAYSGSSYTSGGYSSSIDDSTNERTFTQGGPTGCGIGGSFCGCGSGR